MPNDDPASRDRPVQADHVGRLYSSEPPTPDETRRRALVLILAIVALAALLALRAIGFEPLVRLRLAGFDFIQRLALESVVESQPGVVVVDIDEASLAVHGQWPWPRDKVARIVQTLDQAGARLIAFDILFAEPDRMRPASLVDRLREAPASPEEVGDQFIDPDAALADAIAQSDAPVILASALRGGTMAEEADGEPILPPSVSLVGPSPLPWLHGAQSVVGNIPALESAADGRGFVTIFSDGDGVVRRLPMVAHVGTNLQIGMVAEIVRLAASAESVVIDTHPVFGVAELVIGDRRIRSDAVGAMWLDGRIGQDGDFTARISVSDLLSGRFAPADIADRVVLIGSTALGLGDRVTIADGSVRAGVDVLAAGIRAGLAGQTIGRPGYAVWLEGLAALIIGLAFIYRMSTFGAGRTAIWGVVTVVTIFGLAILVLIATDSLFDATFPALTALIFAVAAGYRRSREIERSRMRTQRALAVAGSFIHRVVDATFDALVAVDRHGRIIFANRSAASLPVLGGQLASGADISAVLGRADSTIGEERWTIDGLVAHEGTADLSIDGSGGQPILLEATATALPDDPNGTVVLVLRDVTARRAAQRHIEAQADELRLMADDLSRQSRDADSARAAAERANAAKSEFLMMMSHELRTPLNAVIGFAELMSEEPFGALGDHRYRAYLGDIRASGGQLLRLIDSILEVVRLDSRDPVGHEATLSIVDLVKGCCAGMQKEAAANGIALSWHASDDVPPFYGDATLMHQVLTSLLSNAIKFSAVGGTVTVLVAIDREGGCRSRSSTMAPGCLSRNWIGRC